MAEEKHFTEAEIKEILRAAIKKESDFKISFGTVTFYKILRDRKYSIITSAAATAAITVASVKIGGLHISGSDAFLVFLGKSIIKHEFGIKHQLYILLKVCYHEYFHTLQFGPGDDLDDYHKAIYKIESIIVKNEWFKYVANHESFFSEIEASKYGIAKAKAFLKENPEQCKGVYEDDKDFIEWEKARNDYDYNNYDLNFLLNILHRIVKKYPDSIRGTFLEAVYENDGSFKKISDILQNQMFLALDKRIQYHLIGNEILINGLDISNIPSECLDFIIEALEYRFNLALKRRSINGESLRTMSITTKEWLDNDCSLVNYINIINNLRMLTKRIRMEKRLGKNKGIGNEVESIGSSMERIKEVRNNPR